MTGTSSGGSGSSGKGGGSYSSAGDYSSGVPPMSDNLANQYELRKMLDYSLDPFKNKMSSTSNYLTIEQLRYDPHKKVQEDMSVLGFHESKDKSYNPASKPVVAKPLDIGSLVNQSSFYRRSA